MKGIYSDFKGISWDSKGSKPKLVSPSEVVPLLLPCHQPLLFGDTYRVEPHRSHTPAGISFL